MARVGQRDAQRALVVLGYPLVGCARFRRAAGDIGDQRTMIAQEVRRPIRQILAVQKLERFLGFILRLIDPGARQRARQFADRVAARLGEVIFGLLVATSLEGRQPQECARRAVGGLRRDQLARQGLHAGPVAFAGFHLERLFDQHVVVGVLLQRFAVVARRSWRIVLGARQPAGEIAGEQRAGLGVLLGTIADACSCRRGVWRGSREREIGAILRTAEERARMSPRVGIVVDVPGLPQRRTLAEKAFACDPNEAGESWSPVQQLLLGGSAVRQRNYGKARRPATQVLSGLPLSPSSHRTHDLHINSL